MASSSTDDPGSINKDKIEKWDELSSLVSQTTLSNPTDYSKGGSGADGNFLGDSSEIQENEYLVANENWANINSRLKHHGFRPIKVMQSNDVGELQSGIFLDEAEAHMLKNTIDRLLDDNERRQALVQELITSSNKLQEEVNEKTDKAYRYDREMSRFRKEIKSQQSNIQELEQKRLNELRSHGEEIQGLSIAKADLQARYDVLDQKCVDMEQEIVELRYQNQELITGEQERQTRTNDLPRKEFVIKDDTNSLESRTSQQENSDDHFVNQDDETSNEGDDVLQSTPKNTASTSFVDEQATKQEIVPSAKLLERQLKTTEKHVEESKKLINLLEEDNKKLTSELKKRPGLDEWQKAWRYNKKLERILLQNNLSISSRKGKENESSQKRIKRFTTQVKDIDFLPIDICRKHIKRICLRLNLSDLKEIIPVLESFLQLSETQKKMEELIRKILEIIDLKNIPFALLDDISESTEPRDHSVYCEKAWKLILPTLKTWSNEVKKIQELKQNVIQLCQTLLPWMPVDDLFQSKSDKINVEDIKVALEKIINESRSEPLQHDDPATIKQLRCIVVHFQKLFDVKNIAGVFPRMNEIYTRVGEAHNVMKTIRETLSLDPNASSAEVVNAICKIQTAKHYLKIQDLPGILKRLEEYDEFFPAFQSLVSQLYDLLGVDKIDEILTAVRALIKFPLK